MTTTAPNEKKANTYVYDRFIETAEKTAQEAHVDNFQLFVENVKSNLQEVENKLNGSYTSLFSDVWDPHTDPIKIRFQPQDDQRFDELINTNNKLLGKILLVLAHLSREMTDLNSIAREKFYPALSVFGEHPTERVEDGEMQLQFGRTLPLLMNLWNFVERINIVIRNTVQQLASLYSHFNRTEMRQGLESYKQVHFHGIFADMAELLGTLITIEEIIQQNHSFQNHVTLYKRMISKVMDEPEAYGTDKVVAGKIQYLLQKLDGDVLSDSLLDGCITRNFEDDMNQIEVANNKLFKAEFLHNLKTYFYYVTTTIGESKECDKRYKFVGFCGLYTLYFNLFRDTTDKKFFKQIWDMHRKIPVIHLYGSAVWSPAQFFINRTNDAANLIKLIGVKQPKKEMMDVRKSALKYIDDGLESNVKSLYMNLNIWISRIESAFISEEPADVISTEASLILQGLYLAFQISNLLKTSLLLHRELEVPLKLKQVVQLIKCIEMLKAIESTYHRRSFALAKNISLLMEFISFKIQKLLLPLKNRLESKKKMTDVEIDQLSSVNFSLELLSYPPSPKRVLLLRLALAVALQKTAGLIRETEFEEVRNLLRRLDMISNFEGLLKAGCDCSILYWHRPLIEEFFKYIYRDPSRAHVMKYIFAALQDAEPIVKSVVHLQDKNALLEAYKNHIQYALQEHIISPLCEDVEKDLRLHIHATVLGKVKHDLSEEKGKMKDLSQFFKIRPIDFFGKLIDIKRRVISYLDRTFYNYTTITMNDWKTYEEMRNLAKKKYGLELTNVYLPGQTLEQGLDLLVITRNIHVFVSRFAYELNNNMFIERPAHTDAKNLNTIHIRHVANSIRTHGTGIMNTTVNFVYKFLGKKFYIFSQFLYDDHIKSRLIRDARYFKDNAMKLDNQYPWKRAMKFNKDIKKLGTNKNNQSYLDQFRDLIIEIGNALGYVRMVRAGGLRYISDAIKFVPDLDNIENFEELVKEDGLSNETGNAAKNLYSVLTNLRQKFAEGSDYFKVLEQVFTKEMQKEQNKHLKNFYIIVPPLTISFVDHMLIAKDKMIRAGKEANFTDGGFALGLAFILKILNQNAKFDSLHWFESVSKRYREEYEYLKKKISEDSKVSEEDAIQTMKLTVNRVKALMKEFELLFFSFSGSRLRMQEKSENEQNMYPPHMNYMHQHFQMYPPPPHFFPQHYPQPFLYPSHFLVPPPPPPPPATHIPSTNYEETQNKESTGDLWLDYFIENLKLPEYDPLEWKPLKVKRELLEIKELKNKLQELVNSAKEDEETLNKARELKNEISAKMKKFENKELFSKFLQKINKTRRNKRRKKRLKLLKSLSKIDEERVQQLIEQRDREINEWQALRRAKDLEVQRIDEEKKEEQRKTAERKLLEKKIAQQKQLIDALIQLGKLRNPNENWDAFRVENTQEEQKTQNTTTSYEHSTTFPVQNDEEISKKLEHIETFYNRGNTDLLNLIEIRRAWDIYLVSPEDGGSKIPSHFVEPPSNPNEEWSKFLVKKE